MSINEPQYWRMQLHPATSGVDAEQFTNQCLKARRIGLDVASELKCGDWRNATRSQLGEFKFYYDFYEIVDIGDIVLIALGTVPVALVRVIGEYKYSPEPDRAEVWCQHHRKVEVLGYYKDCADKLPPVPGRASRAIQRINPKGAVYRFVQAWVGLTAY